MQHSGDRIVFREYNLLHYSILYPRKTLTNPFTTFGFHSSYRYVRWCDFVESKNGATNRPYFAYGVLFICTISLIISIWINDWAFESMSINPSFGPSAETLLRMGAKDSNLIVNSYQVWRLFTPMFLRK